MGSTQGAPKVVAQRNQRDVGEGDPLRRTLRVLHGGAGPVVVRDGRSLINMGSNNYLGLATDARVVAAAQKALADCGTGAGASPLVAGHFAEHAQLADAVATLKKTEAAVIFPTGYAANLGAITALAGAQDFIFADARNHASLIDGCRLSGARVRHYRHRDLEHLGHFLARAPAVGDKFIVTDGVFSMDGSLAPLPDLVTIAKRWDATLIVDDAHGTGVVGASGGGTAELFGIEDAIPVQIGSFSKALGSQGGFVAGSRRVIDTLIQRARSLIYSTGLAPAAAAAACTAIRIVGEEPRRRRVIREHRDRLRAGLLAQGWIVAGGPDAPMLGIVVGTAEASLAVAARLEAGGVFAPAIRPPTVKPGTSRIRLAPMATHSAEQIEKVLEVFGVC